MDITKQIQNTQGGSAEKLQLLAASEASEASKYRNTPGLFLIFVLVILSIPFLISLCSAEDTMVIESQHGVDKSMTKKILVAYGTRAGSTAEVADAIGKKLALGGVAVDVKPVQRIQSLNGYQAVVLGSAIRAGKLLPEVRDFFKAHKEEFRKLPVAYFVVCMTLREDTPEKRKIVNAYLDPLRAEITPIDAGLFAGKMDYSKLGFSEKFIIKNVVKVPEGDLRNWQEINNWAEQLLPKLVETKK
jgi:menaquinone-dependent protoporphyrinogen oxidase